MSQQELDHRYAVKLITVELNILKSTAGQMHAKSPARVAIQMAATLRAISVDEQRHFLNEVDRISADAQEKAA